MASIAASASSDSVRIRFQQKFQSSILTRECDRGKQNGTKPGVVRLHQRFLQSLEGLRRMRSGDREGGFSGIVVGRD